VDESLSERSLIQRESSWLELTHDYRDDRVYVLKEIEHSPKGRPSLIPATLKISEHIYQTMAPVKVATWVKPVALWCWGHITSDLRSDLDAGRRVC
jgi:hypothetical protein